MLFLHISRNAQWSRGATTSRATVCVAARGNPMTSPCHASAGTCSAINIGSGCYLRVVWESRRERALSTEHEKAIVFGRWTRSTILDRETFRHMPRYGLGPPSSRAVESWRAFVPSRVRTSANYFLAFAPRIDSAARTSFFFYYSSRRFLATLCVQSKLDNKFLWLLNLSAIKIVS